MTSNLVLINGMPGTGKTTLAEKLRCDTGLPLISKDYLKESLFDSLGVRDRNWSKMLGKIASQMLYVAIDGFLERDESLLVECPFFTEFARPAIKSSVEAYDARCLEIYCTTEPSEHHRRFAQRASDASRHHGHADGDIEITEASRIQYAPLSVGDIIEIDTTQFGEVEYADLLTKMKGYLL